MRPSTTLFRQDAALGGPNPCAVGAGPYLWVSWTDQSARTMLARHNGNRWAEFVLHTWGAVDIHNSASVCILPNGKIMAVYCPHDTAGGSLYKRITDSAFGIDFGAESTIGSTNAWSYPTLLVVGSRVWLFVNDGAGSGRDIRYAYSDDNGATWSSFVLLWQTAGSLRAYFGVSATEDGEILMVVAKGNGDNASELAYGLGDGYFLCRAAAGVWTDANGGSYTLPFTAATAQQCYEASTDTRNLGFNQIPFKDSDGHYNCAIHGRGASNDDGYYLLKHDGASWSQAEIPVADVDPTGGIYPDSVTPWTFYLSAGSPVQMHRYVTADGGDTWDAEQLTDLSGGDPVAAPRHVVGGPVKWLLQKQTRTSNEVWSGEVYPGAIIHDGTNVATLSAPSAAVVGSTVTLTVTESFA
jgi:hypothetical protein